MIGDRFAMISVSHRNGLKGKSAVLSDEVGVKALYSAKELH